MKIVSVVGARPQFIKLGPLCRAVSEHNLGAAEPVRHLIVHTGQHYDARMSACFFEELQLPTPDFDLGVGSGSHGRQTGQMLEKLESVLSELKPDIVVVFGDTNSTLAAALAAAKMHLPLAHVEAGLRSRNRRMPEEINRIATDHVCDLLFAPTTAAMENLARENLASRALFTGDVMYDAVRFYARSEAQPPELLADLGASPGRYGVVTIHRADNTEACALRPLLESLNDVADERLPLIFPMHPRTRSVIDREVADWTPSPRLKLTEPVGYLAMLSLVKYAQLVLTDSGGLQKEAFFLNCPCITLRGETEWPETVEGDGNVLVDAADAGRDAIMRAVSKWQERIKHDRVALGNAARRCFGDGRAASRILNALLEWPNLNEVGPTGQVPVSATKSSSIGSLE